MSSSARGSSAYPSRRLALTLLLCGPLLTACAGPAVLVRQEVPEALLSCQEAPAPPEGAYADPDLALWIVDLAASGEDCRSKLTAVRGLLR